MSCAPTVPVGVGRNTLGKSTFDRPRTAFGASGRRASTDGLDREDYRDIPEMGKVVPGALATFLELVNMRLAARCWFVRVCAVPSV